MIAVPLLYNHRMNTVALSGSIVAFIGIPFLAGILQKNASHLVTLAVVVLLFLCPIVYAVTDPLAVRFEKLRDGHLLATGAMIIFVSAVWLVQSIRTRMRITLLTAVMGLILGVAEVCMLLWMIVYFE